MMTYAVELKEIEPQIVASIRTTSSWNDFNATLKQLLEEVQGYLTRVGVEPIGPPFARYHTVNDADVEFDAGLPIASPINDEGRISIGKLGGVKAATTWHIGPHDALVEARSAVKLWIGEQGLAHDGAGWEIYWSGLRDAAATTWRSQVVVPVKWPVRAVRTMVAN